MFSSLANHYFWVSKHFNRNLGRRRNDSKYRDVAPLTGVDKIKWISYCQRLFASYFVRVDSTLATPSEVTPGDLSSCMVQIHRWWWRYWHSIFMWFSLVLCAYTPVKVWNTVVVGCSGNGLNRSLGILSYRTRILSRGLSYIITQGFSIIVLWLDNCATRCRFLDLTWGLGFTPSGAVICESLALRSDTIWLEEMIEWHINADPLLIPFDA